MTYSAGLVLIGLVVERWRARRSKVQRCRVTLQAQRVDIVAGEQPRVWRAMREMAGSATLGLQRRMLVHKRAGSLGMALGADRVLIHRRLEHLVLKRAMRIVAIAA